jgi:hypothetical protein
VSRRILKWTIQPDVTLIETADVPTFLSVGTQGERVVVWAEATAGEGVQSLLAAVMTGQEPPPNGLYIGTTQVGPIVVHVYRGPDL